jgi:anti-anti-sigma regulatory factor
MLRLTTIAQNGAATTILVAGQIVAEWVAFLEDECATLLRDGRSLHLDLSDVTYIDSKGVDALNRLAPRQLTITNCPPLIRELLDREEL